jgi:hypothetical protein
VLQLAKFLPPTALLCSPHRDCQGHGPSPHEQPAIALDLPIGAYGIDVTG